MAAKTTDKDREAARIDGEILKKARFIATVENRGVYHFTLQRNSVSHNDQRNWNKLTGKTNIALWKGFKPGEMLFLGADWNGSAFSQWTVNFHFAFSEDWCGANAGRRAPSRLGTRQ